MDASKKVKDDLRTEIGPTQTVSATNSKESVDWENIDLNKLTKKDWKEQFLDDYYSCVLCGGELSYSQVTKFTDLEVNEEAHCLTCGVRNHKATHRLQ